MTCGPRKLGNGTRVTRLIEIRRPHRKEAPPNRSTRRDVRAIMALMFEGCLMGMEAFYWLLNQQANRKNVVIIQRKTGGVWPSQQVCLFDGGGDYA